MGDSTRFPFLFGTQYYRAPTPEPACWPGDLDAIRDLGFTMVKYFVQWRWSHRAPDRYTWDDLDALMDLAAARGLGVTLNVLLDMSPLWLYDAYPDAKQVTSSGVVIQPYVVGHRSIGGHPGPCYRHPGALEARRRFVEEAVTHFRGAPALAMWDVWNEPELSFPQRTPDIATMVCYCPHCAREFRGWLGAKYGSVHRLNDVWGRCYERWNQVELPRGTGGFTDFIDWREFHLDTLAREASWRLETVRRLDPAHGRYLHVVPNTWFSAVTCADDFALARECEVFAATMNGQPEVFGHVISAARGKCVYNVESHVDFGGTGMHQRRLHLPDLLKDLLPQIGAGVKGFLFWQYRAETLGAESPAWGLVRPDGSPRPVTEAARLFWAALAPHAAELRRAAPPAPRVGVWRSRKNEIFHFCVDTSVSTHNAGVNGWIRALYERSIPYRLVNDEMLARGELDGLDLAILPCPYYLTHGEADALDTWVRAGGVLLTEAHLGGYDGTTGRHSAVLPGCGLAERWGFRETESTSAFHLPATLGRAGDGGTLADDIRKALAAAGTTGGRYYPVRLASGEVIWGANRYAELGGTGLEPLGSFDGTAPCLGRVAVGRGAVYYCGANLGEAPETHAGGVRALLGMAAVAAGVTPVLGVLPGIEGTVHLDVLAEGGRPRFAVVVSSADREQTVHLVAHGTWTGLYTGSVWRLGGASAASVPAGFAELFVVRE